MLSAEPTLWALIAGSAGLLLIDWQDGSRREQTWIDCGDDERWERLLSFHQSEGNDPRVSLVPRRDRHLDNVGLSQMFWVRGETGDAWSRLQNFRPKPTLILRDGLTCRYTACWWLEKALPMTTDPSTDWLTRGNRRLAAALGGRMGASVPEWLMPFQLAHVHDAGPDRIYSAKAVVGRLADRPKRPRNFAAA